MNGYSADFLFLYPPDSLPVCSNLSVPLFFFFSVSVCGYLCVCPPLACSLCLSSARLFSVSVHRSPVLCFLCRSFSFPLLNLSVVGNYAALSNASQREVCEGFGTDNEYQTPANLFVTCLQSPRHANIECLLALCSLSVCRSACLHSMVLSI